MGVAKAHKLPLRRSAFQTLLKTKVSALGTVRFVVMVQHLELRRVRPFARKSTDRTINKIMKSLRESDITSAKNCRFLDT